MVRVFAFFVVLLVKHSSGQPVRPNMPTICPVETPCTCKYKISDGKREFTLLCKYLALDRVPSIVAPSYVALADFSNNRMKRIRKDDLQGLTCESLDFRNNKLVGIQKEALSSLKATLKRLDLSKNYFRFVPVNAIKHLENLEFLDLSNDAKPFGAIEKLISRGFSGLRKLKTLNLSGNKLSNVNSDAFVGLEDSLTNLDLSNSMLKYIPSSITKLKLVTSLNLANGGGFLIPGKAFYGMNSLKHLDLSKNDLSKRNSFKDNSFLGIEDSLEFLDLRECQMTKLPNVIRTLHTLKTLNLYGNMIYYYPDSFATLHSLTDLNIGGYPLKLPKKRNFEGIGDTLVNLSMAMTKLSELPPDFPRSFPNLRYLDLSRNDFKVIIANFSAVSSIVNYNFDYNDIVEISKLAFMPTTSGEKIELSLKNSRLRSVTFAGNPCIFKRINFGRNLVFPCGCDVYRLQASGVDVLGHCIHKKSPILINDKRFRYYYASKCGRRKVNCEEPQTTRMTPTKMITKNAITNKTTQINNVRSTAESNAGSIAYVVTNPSIAGHKSSRFKWITTNPKDVFGKYTATELPSYIETDVNPANATSFNYVKGVAGVLGDGVARYRCCFLVRRTYMAIAPLHPDAQIDFAATFATQTAALSAASYTLSVALETTAANLKLNLIYAALSETAAVTAKKNAARTNTFSMPETETKDST